MNKLLFIFLVLATRLCYGQNAEQDRMSLLSRYERFAATPGRVVAVSKLYVGKVREWRVEVRKVTDVKTDSSLLGLNFFFREQGVHYSFFFDADELPNILDMLNYARQVVEKGTKDKPYVDVATSNGVNVSCYYFSGLYIKTWYLVCRHVYPGTNIKAYSDALQIPGSDIDRMIALLQQAQTALAKL